MPKAEIKSTNNGNGLWLFIDRNDNRETTADELPNVREEDSEENVAYALQEDEILPILQACTEYVRTSKLEGEPEVNDLTGKGWYPTKDE